MYIRLKPDFGMSMLLNEVIVFGDILVKLSLIAL